MIASLSGTWYPGSRMVTRWVLAVTMLLGGCVLRPPPVLTAPHCAMDTGDSFCRLGVFKPSGQGGIAGGDLFVNQVDRTVYRVWDGAKPFAALGGWWALDAPSSTEEEYRAQYVLCKNWGPLTRVRRCTLKAGAVVAKGTGAAAKCESGELAASPVIQLYLPYPAAALDACVDSDAPWATPPPIQRP